MGCLGIEQIILSFFLLTVRLRFCFKCDILVYLWSSPMEKWTTWICSIHPILGFLLTSNVEIVVFRWQLQKFLPFLIKSGNVLIGSHKKAWVGWKKSSRWIHLWVLYFVLGFFILLAQHELYFMVILFWSIFPMVWL